MKKLSIMVQLMLALFAFNLVAEAAEPVDGYYEGVTSQGQLISFEVIDGEVRRISSSFYPSCTGGSAGFAGYIATFYDDVFKWASSVIQDEYGDPVGLNPGSSFAFFAFGIFETSTYATGEIWHARAYFRGTELSTHFCSDTVTYEASYVDVMSQASSPQPYRKTITIFDDSAEIIQEIE